MSLRNAFLVTKSTKSLKIQQIGNDARLGKLLYNKQAKKDTTLQKTGRGV